MSDTIVVMSQGCVQQIGSPEAIYASPVNLFVAKFVGELNELPARVLSLGASLHLETPVGSVMLPRSAVQGFSPSVGDSATLCLRPESASVTLGTGPSNHVNLTGRLVDVVSLGPVSRLVLDVAGRRMTSIIMSEHRPEGLTSGSPCTLHFDPERERVYSPLDDQTAGAFGDTA